MKIDVVQVSRRLNWPVWVVPLIFVWLSLGAATIWLGRYLDRPVHLCLLKRFTGFPCPTCGFTRGLFSMMHGDIIQTWLYNPLLFSALILLFIVTAFRIISGRSLRVYLTRTERQITWTISFVLLFVNWIYVIFYVG